MVVDNMPDINLNKSQPRELPNGVRVAIGFFLRVALGAAALGIIVGFCWGMNWLFSHNSVKIIVFSALGIIFMLGVTWIVGNMVLAAFRDDDWCD